MGTWWDRFRRWPVWAQVLLWVAVWPVPLVLLALARPGQRRQWGAAALVGALVWGGVALSNSGEPRADADDAAATTTTSEPPPSTIDEQISTTTTEPAGLGAIPDTSLSGADTDPATVGGLSTLGAGVFDVEELLGRVEVAPANETVDYDRERFDEGADDDGDGCRTRAEVLIAESITPAQVDPSGCRVLAGDWRSIYDGATTDDPVGARGRPPRRPQGGVGVGRVGLVAGPPPRVRQRPRLPGHAGRGPVCHERGQEPSGPERLAALERSGALPVRR